MHHQNTTEPNPARPFQPNENRIIVRVLPPYGEGKPFKEYFSNRLVSFSGNFQTINVKVAATGLLNFYDWEPER